MTGGNEEHFERRMNEVAERIKAGQANVGALGCRRAMLLDGGISSQLLLRLPDGETEAWRGLRQVPLGLVVLPRPPGT